MTDYGVSNYIHLRADNSGSFYGELSQHWAYTREYRAKLDELFGAAKRSLNRYFVLNGMTVLAAQSTLDGAKQYMQEGLILLHVDVPGPDSRKELARVRKNRAAREKYEVMKTLGLKKTAYGWE